MRLLWILLATSATAQTVAQVDAIALTVSDLDRSVAFYQRVLHFEPMGTDESDATAVAGPHTRRARMKLGDERIELQEYVVPAGKPAPADARSNDRWFQHIAIIVRDMDAAYSHLKEQKVRHVSPAPQRLPDWNPNAGGIRAFYFQDPDGHPLEVLWFPPGKGDRKWHASGPDRLFLGIDHTAIVVRDTAASLGFYRDQLGLRVAGTSENYGPEQARLNNVDGAHLRITTLRAPSGPGIELLEYVSPAGGRQLAVQPNDLLYWQTRLLSQSGNAGARPGYRKSRIARDPDGHAIEIVQQNK